MNERIRLGFTIDLGDGSQPIAMVDDETLDYEIARRFHERSDLANPFVHFRDGPSFIAYLERSKGGEAPLPILVLMDVNMPRMNGFEVIEAMRQDETFRRIPVVSMLTSSSDVRDRERAKTSGADNYMVKPFDPRVYLEFFNSLTAG